jgi:hypothetical protein
VVAAVLMGFLGVAASDLRAQDASVDAGARVRIMTSHGTSPMVGWIDAMGPDGVNLVRETDRRVVLLPRDEILRLERSRVRRSLAKRADPGMAVGGVLGLVVGFTQTEEQQCEPGSWLCFDFPEKVLGGIGVALVGMLAGGLISAIVIPDESWEDASLPALMVETRSGGASVVLRIPVRLRQSGTGLPHPRTRT